MKLSDLNIEDRSDPNFHYGKSATRNARPFQGLVVHHTADKPLDALVNYGKSVDAQRGGAFGYHFYVGKDGRIVQGAPLDRRTNHIKPPSHGARVGGGRLSNADAIGITLVGAEHGSTPQQREAAQRLGQALMAEYRIQANNIYGHGQLQSDRQGHEGVELVELLRSGGGADVLAGQSSDGYFSQWYSQAPQNEQPAPQNGQSGGYFAQNYRPPEPSIPTEAPAQPQGMAGQQQQPGFARRQANAVRDWVVGDAQYDVPELGQTPDAMRQVMGDGDPNELAARLMLADGEQAMANIIQEASPDTPIVADENGNLYAEVNGQRFALDKSGWSPHDVTEVSKFLLGAMGVSKVARIGGAVAGNAGRIGAAGAAVGAEDLAAQAASEMAGGGQGLDMTRSILAGAFGLAGEAGGVALEFLGPRIADAIGRSKISSTNRAEFELRLMESGFSPDEVEQALAGALRRSGVQDFDGDALARIAEAESLPTPVPLTAGQATRNPALYAEEARLSRGAGDEVGQEAMSVSMRQQRALGQNAQNLVAPSDVASRGRMVQERIVRQREDAWSKVNQAYDRARSAPGQARIAAGPIREMIDGLRRQHLMVPDNKPVTARMLGAFDSLLEASGGRVTAVDVRTLERWRSEVAGALRDAKGQDRQGLASLARTYDIAMQRGLKNNVVSGDPNTIGLWRNAAKARADFGRKYEHGDIIEQLSKKARGRSGELEIDSEDVMAQILGKSTLGTRTGAAREIRRLRDYLGADSPQFEAVKAQAVVKMLGVEPSEFVEGNFPAKFVGSLRKAFQEHPEVINALFSDSEKRALRRFASVVKNVNVAPREAGMGANPSGSGMVSIEAAAEGVERFRKAVEVLARQFGGAGVVLARFVTEPAERAASAARNRAAMRSVQGLPPVPNPGPALPGAGAIAGGSLPQ